MSKSDQRIQLLNEQQIDGLYHIPNFSIDGRENFFKLSENKPVSPGFETKSFLINSEVEEGEEELGSAFSSEYSISGV